MIQEDGLGPIPRPIPILHRIGTNESIKPDSMYALVVRVVEYGWDDVSRMMVMHGTDLTREDGLERLLDYCIHDLLKVVGRRHGIWIAHVVRFPDHYLYGPKPFDPEYLPLPEVARAVRKLAEAASEYQPLIEFDPALPEVLWGDGEKSVLRARLRDEDVQALGLRMLGGGRP